MSEPTQPSSNNTGVPGTGEPQRPIPPGYYSGQGVPPGYHPGYTAQPGYHPGYAVHPGYHPGYGQPGYPYAGQPHPPAPVPPRPKEVTRAGLLLIISAVLQVAVFALMIASLTGSTATAPLALFALAGTGIYLVVAVALNFFLRSGFRFARIIAAGMAAMSLLGSSNSFIFGPAAGVVSLLAVASWVGAAVLLFQRPANEFFRGSWNARRARLLNRF